jgi:hypothetical protein
MNEAKRIMAAWGVEQKAIESLREGLRVRPRAKSYPWFKPSRETACLYSYGPGHAIPYPEVNSAGVGGDWEVVLVWQTGWVSVRSLVTGQLLFSVPPTSFEIVPQVV